MTKAKIILFAWLAFVICLPLIPHGAKLPEGPSLAALDLSISGWLEHEDKLTDTQKFFLLEKDGSPFLDQMRIATLTNSQGARIDVQIFYHRNRQSNAWGDFADMVNCWHGRYFQLESTPVRLAPNALATQLTMYRKNELATALYWMQSPGRTSSSGWPHIAWQYMQELFSKRADACFIKLSYSGKNDPKRNEQLQQVAKIIHLRLDKWLAQRK